jgi:hypothetical protein
MRIWATDIAGFGEAVFLDDCKGLFSFSPVIGKVEHPVIAIDNLPTVINVADSGINRIESEAVFPGHWSNGRALINQHILE